MVVHTSVLEQKQPKAQFGSNVGDLFQPLKIFNFLVYEIGARTISLLKVVKIKFFVTTVQELADV